MEGSYLVQRGSLEEVLGVLLEKQKTIILDLWCNLDGDCSIGLVTPRLRK